MSVRLVDPPSKKEVALHALAGASMQSRSIGFRTHRQLGKQLHAGVETLVYNVTILGVLLHPEDRWVKRFHFVINAASDYLERNGR